MNLVIPTAYQVVNGRIDGHVAFGVVFTRSRHLQVTMCIIGVVDDNVSVEIIRPTASR